MSIWSRCIGWIKGRSAQTHRSELDLFLKSFDMARRTEPLSRRQERLKHEKVVQQRDHGVRFDGEWPGF